MGIGGLSPDRNHPTVIVKPIATLQGKRCHPLCCAPLAPAGVNGTVKLWDLNAGMEAITLKPHGKPVTSVAFSPDGKRLAAAGGDRTVAVWELPGGNEMLTLSPPDLSRGRANLAAQPDRSAPR